MPASGAFLQQAGFSEAGEKIEPYISRTIESYSRLLDFATSESHLEQNESRSIMLECQNVAMLAFLTREAKDYVIASDAIHFRECQNTQIRYDLLMSAEASDPAPTIGLVSSFVKTTVPASTASTIWRRRDFSIGRFCAPTTRCS